MFCAAKIGKKAMRNALPFLFSFVVRQSSSDYCLPRSRQLSADQNSPQTKATIMAMQTTGGPGMTGMINLVYNMCRYEQIMRLGLLQTKKA